MSRIEFPNEPENVDYAPPMLVYWASRVAYVGGAIALPFVAGNMYGGGGTLLGSAATMGMLAVGCFRMASDKEGFETTKAFAAANKEYREKMLLGNGGPIAFSALPMKARAGAQMMTWLNTLAGGSLSHKVLQAEKLVVELGEDGETYWLTSHSNKGVSEPTLLSKDRFLAMKEEIDKTGVPLQMLKKVNDPDHGEVILEYTTLRGKLDSTSIKGPGMRVIKAGPEIQSHADLPHLLENSAEVLAEAWFDGTRPGRGAQSGSMRLSNAHELIERYAPPSAVPQHPAELVTAKRRASYWHMRDMMETSFPNGHDSLPAEIKDYVEWAEKVTFSTLATSENDAVVLVSVGDERGEAMPCRILNAEQANTWHAALAETDYIVEVDGAHWKRGAEYSLKEDANSTIRSR
jgi:hypothetical protein